MIATKTGVRDSDYSNTQYSPIFRVKNLPNSKARLHTTAFINFTVWWESRTAYTKKTYSTNATLHSANSTNTYNCILVDETPDNADFEVVALSDGSSNGYTTYYVNAPIDSAYSGVPAQIVINKCDLLPSIEFLGGRPFNVTINDADIIRATSQTKEEVIEYPLIEKVAVSFTKNGSGFDVMNKCNNIALTKEGYLYVDYSLYTDSGTSGVLTDILTLTGMKPTKNLDIISPYGYRGSGAEGGMCKFTITTDGQVNIECAYPSMITRLFFILDSSQYTLTETSDSTTE